jgi:hypothetical protein
MYEVRGDDIYRCECDKPACLDYVDVYPITSDPKCASNREGYILQEPAGECTGPDIYECCPIVRDQVVSATFRYDSYLHPYIERCASDLVIHPALAVAKAEGVRD